MHHVTAVCEQRWPGVIVLAVGVAVFAFGLWANVTNGGDLQRLGQLVFLVGFGRVSHQAHAKRMRDAYRAGRSDKRRFGPVLVKLPRHDEANR